MTLLSTFKENDDCEVNHKRIESSAIDNSSRFLLPIKKREYEKQYFYVYSHRLETLRERITATVKKELGPKADIRRLSDLDDIQNEKSVVVIGTLFKAQILKPSILKEVGEVDTEAHEGAEEKVPLDKYIDESDELVLEDELQRARLHFTKENEKHNVDQYVTGIVCGVLGSLVPSEAAEGGGKFKVERMFMPDFPEQIPRPKLEEKNHQIAFISGIELSGESTAQCLGALELASSWINGELGDENDQETNSKIERLVIAGNSLSSETRDKKILSTAKYLTSGHAAKSVHAVNAFDEILQDFSSGLNVDLMPGENDPANQNLPQQPLHLCLFPRSSRFKTLKTVSNPYSFESNGVTFLGTSGQNVEDIIQNSSLTDPIEVLECIIRWSHIAPTCPDTLGCFPFKNNDPFVIEKLPHVFFVGNQKKFAQKLIKLDSKKEVLLITLPKFSTSSTLILLNLNTLKCEPLVLNFLDK